MPFVSVEKLVGQYKLPDEKPSLETLIFTLSFQVVKQPIHFMNNDLYLIGIRTRMKSCIHHKDKMQMILIFSI